MLAVCQATFQQLNISTYTHDFITAYLILYLMPSNYHSNIIQINFWLIKNVLINCHMLRKHKNNYTEIGVKKK